MGKWVCIYKICKNDQTCIAWHRNSYKPSGWCKKTYVAMDNARTGRFRLSIIIFSNQQQQQQQQQQHQQAVHKVKQIHQRLQQLNRVLKASFGLASRIHHANALGGKNRGSRRFVENSGLDGEKLHPIVRTSTFFFKILGDQKGWTFPSIYFCWVSTYHFSWSWWYAWANCDVGCLEGHGCFEVFWEVMLTVTRLASQWRWSNQSQSKQDSH